MRGTEREDSTEFQNSTLDGRVIGGGEVGRRHGVERARYRHGDSSGEVDKCLGFCACFFASFFGAWRYLWC